MSPADRLEDETTILRALLTVLRQEQACLSAGDADAHGALLGHKARCVAELSRLADERHRALGRLGLPASEDGMHHWLAAAPDVTRDAWASLMALARDAHEINRINGQLLGQWQARQRQALAALGLGPPNALYGASGEAGLASPGSRPVRATG